MKFMNKLSDYWRDKKSTNLYVGKEIGNDRLKGEITSLNDNNMVIKILSIDDKYYDKYLDVGEYYPLSHYQFIHKSLTIWQIRPSSMKRQMTPFLLVWERGVGWKWTLK